MCADVSLGPKLISASHLPVSDIWGIIARISWGCCDLSEMVIDSASCKLLE